MKQDLTFTKPLIRGIKRIVNELPQLIEEVGAEKINNLSELSNEEVMALNIQLQRAAQEIRPTHRISDGGGDAIGLMIEHAKERKINGVVVR
jgi:hypothetical protein